MDNYLFVGNRLADAIRNQQAQVEAAAGSLAPQRALGVPVAELVEELAGQYRIDPLELDYDAMFAEHNESNIDVSRDPMRMIVDRSRPFYL